MKIMITGASGLLGRAIKKELDQVKHWTILGLGYSRLDGGLRKVDLLNQQHISDVIEDYRPDIVIHSAAERRPDNVKNKKSETEALNITASETIAKHVNKYGGCVVYISTDYVFDGKSPPFTTTSKPNPLNDYGKTKLDGENATIRECSNHIILRVPVLYGDIQSIEESAVTGLFSTLCDASRSASVSNYEKRYPTSTADVAVVCREIIEYREKNSDFHGIFQWQGNEQLTKYEMIKIMSDLFDKPMKHITANDLPSSGAPRPYHCQMDCSDLEKLGIGGSRTSFRDGIKACLAKYQ